VVTAQPIISVVDGCPTSRRVFVRLVQELNLPVAAFSSEAEFWEECNLLHPGCVLLDLGGVHHTGLDLLVRLVDQVCHPPVIMLADQPNVPLAVRAMQAGAVHFFDKAGPHPPIVQAVRDALAIDAQWRKEQATVHRLRQRWAQLNGGEREVLELLLEGASNQGVAEHLGVSLRAIEVRRAKLMRKMHAASLAELVKMAVRIQLDKGPRPQRDPARQTF
jgi:two-component system response regulator FixJ